MKLFIRIEYLSRYGGLLEIFFKTKVRRHLDEQNVSMPEILTSIVRYSSFVFL